MSSLRRSLLTIVTIVAAMLAAASPAWAHEGMTGSAAGGGAERTRATVEVEAGAFHLAGRIGDWQLVAPAFELAVGSRLSFRARLPVARLAFADGTESIGLADASLSARVIVYRTPGDRLVLCAGLAAELPTGDADSGLGGGKVAIQPMIGASTKFALAGGDLTVGAEVSDLKMLGEIGNPPWFAPTCGCTIHGSAITPHTSHELAAAPWGSWTRGAWTASARIDVFIPLSGGDPFVSARAASSFALSRKLSLSAALELPTAGDQRFDWKAGIAASWTL